MAITATSAESGAYPLPGEEVTLAFTTTTAATTARYYLTSVPDESALETGFIVDAAGAYLDTFTPDVPGAYGIRADLWWKRIGVAQYDGDPAGGTRETFKESQTATIYVGDVLDLPIVTLLEHGVTVRLGIFNATCRTAEFALPLTDASRVAALDATALASLATCVDVAVTALDDTLTTSVTELRTKYEAHRVHSSHAASDTVNVMGREAPYANRSARVALNELHDKLLAHMTTGSYHASDDNLNLPLCGKAQDDAQATVLAAELRFRVYNLHRVQNSSPASHTAPGDTTNTLTAAKPLAATVRDFLAALAYSTAPTGEQSGAVVAMNLFGFKRAA
jgi:hypothetical protein